jgi:hypothetical protein
VTILLIKLFLTPLFIGGITLAGRRWGPAVSGLLVGLPLTSGPISVFLALQYGPGFAARAAVGNIAGMASSCVFCLVYGLAALCWSWRVCSALALLAFLGCTALGNPVPWTLLSASLVLLGAILAVPRLMGRGAGPALPSAPPRWDLPARMVVATAFVLALTASARALGPQLSGLIAPFPIFATVLGAFTQHRQGPAAAVRLLRGVVVGSLAFISFFVIAGLGLGRGSLAAVYGLAALGSLATSGAAFLAVRGRARWFSSVFGG